VPGVTVIFHRLAAKEYLAAFRWYARQSLRTAGSFLAEIDRACSLIAENPLAWPIFHRRFRFFKLRRFNYVLYFRVIDDCRVQVLAVAHGRRRPGYWFRRRHP
jgi:plasmid stabilization system protein ParE